MRICFRTFWIRVFVSLLDTYGMLVRGCGATFVSSPPFFPWCTFRWLIFALRLAACVSSFLGG